MTAQGIHDHDTLKLGLAPHSKSGGELLEVLWKAGVVPSYPPTYDAMSGVTAGLDKNDTYGDCGPTSADNHRRIKTKRETGTQVSTSLADVLNLYALSSNPAFDPATGANDNGVQMPDLLNAMRKYGVGGEKIVAFGRLTDKSDPSIMAAISTFKAVLFAVDLQTAQQSQSSGVTPAWDWVQSPDWGGHAIVAGAYDATAGNIDVFSWARRIKTTARFRYYQLQEVWVPIYQSTIDDTQDTVDWDAMAQVFTNLTGETLPGATPAPSPAPVPTPTPTPAGDAPFPGATDDVATHIYHTAARHHLSNTDWMNHHFANYFGLLK